MRVRAGFAPVRPEVFLAFGRNDLAGFAENHSESSLGLTANLEDLTMPAIDNIRIFEADDILFVTNRCLEAMFLLRPDEDGECQRICLACLAWAAKKHEVEIFAYVFMSNHFHLLVRARNLNLSAFMHDFQRELAARINRHRNRKGTVFPRPFDAPKVIGDEMFLEKLKYIVNNPCLSGLVRRPEDWPGVSSWESHQTGQVQVGRLIDYKELRRLRRKERTTPREEAMRHDELTLATPPMWGDESDEDVCEQVTTLIEEQATELQKERARKRKKVVGPTKVMRKPFRYIPPDPKCSPRVKCLSADADKKREYLEERMTTVDAYKRAMGRWREGKSKVQFPDGTFRPGLCRCA
jgi:REP element-mobilizing transposase RayT